MKSPIVQLIAILLIAIAVVKVNELLFKEKEEFKIGFVDTNKLILGFGEATKINQELEDLSKEYEKNLKTLQDSVQMQMDVMSKQFDAADESKKGEMKQKLRKFNDDLNRYQRFGLEDAHKKHQEKMAVILEKINLYVEEYAKKNDISLVLGASNYGSILYGKECPQNITDELIQGLNQRYR